MWGCGEGFGEQMRMGWVELRGMLVIVSYAASPPLGVRIRPGGVRKATVVFKKLADDPVLRVRRLWLLPFIGCVLDGWARRLVDPPLCFNGFYGGVSSRREAGSWQAPRERFAQVEGLPAWRGNARFMNGGEN